MNRRKGRWLPSFRRFSPVYPESRIIANTYIKYDDIEKKNNIFEEGTKPLEAGPNNSDVSCHQEGGSDHLPESLLDFLEKYLCGRGKDLILLPDDI